MLVTGAGGSIGSELCKQILVQQPKRLVLFDVSEFALYAIEQCLVEMNQLLNCELVALVGSVQDAELVENIVTAYATDTIYHAAAYKHVPMVEKNIVEGIKNNIIGTNIVATIALKLKVSYFVLVSTDKAVRPTNIMGATKRLCRIGGSIDGN